MVRRKYPPEFRAQLIALVHVGRTPESLPTEFEPTARTIRNWLAQAERDTGTRSDGLTTLERTELTRLRRELRQVKIERDILSRAAAWLTPFGRRTGDRHDPQRAYGFVKEHQADFPVATRRRGSLRTTQRRPAEVHSDKGSRYSALVLPPQVLYQ